MRFLLLLSDHYLIRFLVLESSGTCRDGALRASLEARLMFTPPSELLVADPISSLTRRLLGTFSQAVRGLKAETIDGSKYSADSAAAAIQDFYASSEFIIATSSMIPKV